MKTSAILSPCERYRYRLDRTWSAAPLCAWVMCNPSTADAHVDDQTIRKIVAYSKRWEFGAIAVVNLWAWRATDPYDLPFEDASIDVEGEDANAHIKSALADASRVVCGWGSSVHKRHRLPRAEQVKEIIRLAGHEPRALKINVDGSPSHPLYLRGELAADCCL